MNVCRDKKSCEGMTLVEMVVFMSLALMVLGGTFPLLSILLVSDKANEEDLASFLFLQGTKEQLKTVPYTTLTNGFVRNVTASGVVYYEKKTTSTNFYKTISGRYRERLYPKTTPGIGDYYQAIFDLRWSTEMNGLPKKNHYKRINVPLLPNI